MRKIMLATFLLLTPCLGFGAVIPILTVNSATINYGANQVTFNGGGFEPLKKAPTVLFNGAPLTVNTFTNTQVVATLPAGTTAGTYATIVANNPARTLNENTAMNMNGTASIISAVQLDHRDRLGLRGRMVRKDLQGHRGRRGLWATLDRKDRRVRRDRRARLEVCFPTRRSMSSFSPPLTIQWSSVRSPCLSRGLTSLGDRS